MNDGVSFTPPPPRKRKFFMRTSKLLLCSVLGVTHLFAAMDASAQSTPPNDGIDDYSSYACNTVTAFLAGAAGLRLTVYAVDAARAGMVAAGVYVGHRGLTERCESNLSRHLRSFVRNHPIPNDPWRNWERYCDMEPGFQCRRNDPLMWTVTTGYNSYWTGYSCASYGSCLLSSQYGLGSKSNGVSVADLILMMENIEAEARQAPPWQNPDDSRQIQSRAGAE